MLSAERTGENSGERPGEGSAEGSAERSAERSGKRSRQRRRYQLLLTAPQLPGEKPCCGEMRRRRVAAPCGGVPRGEAGDSRRRRS